MAVTICNPSGPSGSVWVSDSRRSVPALLIKRKLRVQILLFSLFLCLTERCASACQNLRMSICGSCYLHPSALQFIFAIYLTLCIYSRFSDTGVFVAIKELELQKQYCCDWKGAPRSGQMRKCVVLERGTGSDWGKSSSYWCVESALWPL